MSDTQSIKYRNNCTESLPGKATETTSRKGSQHDTQFA